MNKRKLGAVVAAIGAALLLTAGSCSPGDPPCETIEPPTREMAISTIQGAEVERELDGEWADTECVAEVTNRTPGQEAARWVDLTDDES